MGTLEPGCWLVAFVVAAVVMARTQQRFYDEVRRVDPKALASDDELLARIGSSPTRLPAIVGAESLVQLRAQFHRSPAPTIERARRRTLISEGIALGILLLLVARSIVLR